MDEEFLKEFRARAIRLDHKLNWIFTVLVSICGFLLGFALNQAKWFAELGDFWKGVVGFFLIIAMIIGGSRLSGRFLEKD